MSVLKSKPFLLIVSGFLLLAIPITTYVVIRSEQDYSTPQAATLCETDCVSDETVDPTASDGDVNLDGSIDIEDMTIIVNSMGKQGNNPADLNNDKVVSEADLVIFKTKWKR